MRAAHDPKMGFGLGVSVTLDVAQTHNLGSVGNYGWSGAASTHYWVDPQEALIGLLMVQFMPNGQYPIHDQLRALVYQALVDG
jgi:CubicO group peptidase (beta-lactamase class C family)